MATTEASPLEAALQYAALGWYLIPLHTPRDDGRCDCNKDNCESPGKHPRTRNGLDDSSNEPETITRWFTMWPHANLGVDLVRSGLVSIAPDSLEWWAEFHARGLPSMHFLSGGGEGHGHFLGLRPPDCPAYRITESGQYDILSAGYAVLPPSLHRSGRRYTWQTPAHLPAEPPAEMINTWAAEMLRERARRRVASGPVVREPGAPPVRLRGEALERWHGRTFDTNPETGRMDRSYSLWSIAVALLDAGCAPHFVEDLLAERDVALGWDKFVDRRNADERYSTIVEKAVASQGPQRIRLNDKTPSTEAPAKAKEAAGFVFTTLEDLLAEPAEETAYLVDGLLPTGGVSLWAAKPKVGKSVAIRNLAMAVSRGESFLERTCHRGPVLVLALEEKRAEVANHFRTMGGTDELIHVHVGAAPSTSKEGLAVIANAIALYQPVLVIADPVLKLVRVRDSSDYAELTRELEPVIQLARTSGCHIATTHHLGKLLREGGDDVLGSTAIFGAVDTLVLMRRRKDNQRVLQSIQRYGTDLAETLIPMDAATGLIALGVAVSEVRLEEARQAVVDLLGKQEPGDGLEQKDVREQAGVHSALAYRALQDLVNESVVSRSGTGKRGDPYRYCLTEKVVFLFSSTSIEKQENNQNGNPDEPLDGSSEELPW